MNIARTCLVVALLATSVSAQESGEISWTAYELQGTTWCRKVTRTIWGTAIHVDQQEAERLVNLRKTAIEDLHNPGAIAIDLQTDEYESGPNPIVGVWEIRYRFTWTHWYPSFNEY